MTGVTFLTREDVLQVHEDQIEQYGGSPEVRDSGLLDSAIATPSATFSGAYLHDGIPAMGAAYMFHLIQNHPFVDGNKRTGTMSSLVFLNLNQMQLDVSNEKLETLAYSIAKGEQSKEQVAELFAKRVVQYNPSEDE